MAKFGLNQIEIVAILSEGIMAGEPVDAEKLKNAIAKAIIKNNEAIEKAVTGTVASGFMKDLRKKGKI